LEKVSLFLRSNSGDEEVADGESSSEELSPQSSPTLGRRKLYRKNRKSESNRKNPDHDQDEEDETTADDSREQLSPRQRYKKHRKAIEATVIEELAELKKKRQKQTTAALEQTAVAYLIA
jgi:hypothetical protein